MSNPQPPITSVWSSYGHTFLDEGDHESCLTCGAVYELVATPDGLCDGAYVAANGDAPIDCTHDTSMGHGEDFMAADSTCNCLLCS